MLTFVRISAHKLSALVTTHLRLSQAFLLTLIYTVDSSSGYTKQRTCFLLVFHSRLGSQSRSRAPAQSRSTIIVHNRHSCCALHDLSCVTSLKSSPCCCCKSATAFPTIN